MLKLDEKCGFCKSGMTKGYRIEGTVRNRYSGEYTMLVVCELCVQDIDDRGFAICDIQGSQNGLNNEWSS